MLGLVDFIFYAKLTLAIIMRGDDDNDNDNVVAWEICRFDKFFFFLGIAFFLQFKTATNYN